MSRIRTVKPEFWTSEQVAECSPTARLLFIGMWNFCDDSGVHRASTKRLKMEVFPSDSSTDDDIAALVAELLKVGLLEKYMVGDAGYWRVTGWHHQRIDQPTYKHPLPDGTIPNSVSRRRPDGERSDSVRRTVIECSPPEGRGVEGNGGEGNGVDVSEPAKSREGERIQEEKTQIDLSSLVLKIGHLYPGNAHLDPTSPLRRIDEEAILQAVIRDGDKVLAGTKAYAAAVATWDKSEHKFIPGTDKFYNGSEYRKDPSVWARTNQASDTPQFMSKGSGLSLIERARKQKEEAMREAGIIA